MTLGTNLWRRSSRCPPPVRWSYTLVLSTISLLSYVAGSLAPIHTQQVCFPSLSFTHCSTSPAIPLTALISLSFHHVFFFQLLPLSLRFFPSILLFFSFFFLPSLLLLFFPISFSPFPLFYSLFFLFSPPLPFTSLFFFPFFYTNSPTLYYPHQFHHL